MTHISVHICKTQQGYLVFSIVTSNFLCKQISIAELRHKPQLHEGKICHIVLGKINYLLNKQTNKEWIMHIAFNFETNYSHHITSQFAPNCSLFWIWSWYANRGNRRIFRYAVTGTKVKWSYETAPYLEVANFSSFQFTAYSQSKT